MLPDTGERYLSTPLFDGITDEMNDEEIALSRSTPNHRFDAPAAPAPKPAACAVPKPAPAAAPLDPDAERFVDETLAAHPVVMFALEWCEFCWSARKLFAALGIEYHSVDLDSVAYQADDRGGRIRAVLAERTGAVTIPRIYVGGEHVGGCTELFDAHADGTLLRKLDDLGVAHREDVDVDAYGLLPGWLHPRKAG
jgi:cysteine synthase A